MSQYTQQLANHRHFILAAMLLSAPIAGESLADPRDELWIILDQVV